MWLTEGKLVEAHTEAGYNLSERPTDSNHSQYVFRRPSDKWMAYYPAYEGKVDLRMALSDASFDERLVKALAALIPSNDP